MSRARYDKNRARQKRSAESKYALRIVVPHGSLPLANRLELGSVPVTTLSTAAMDAKCTPLSLRAALAFTLPGQIQIRSRAGQEGVAPGLAQPDARICRVQGGHRLEFGSRSGCIHAAIASKHPLV